VKEPIDYDEALRDLLKKKRRRQFTGTLRRISDPRPSSPGQVMLVGAALAVVGWLVPGFHLLVTIGLVVLVAGFVTGMMQPRMRRVTWRNREIEIPPEENWGHRVYRALYRPRG
jgi:Flp pilus assembly protein TadB